MEPGAEPEPSRRRDRPLTAKRALLDEYDKADYKARHDLLDREQLTIRQISRWRSELRMAARKKAARRPTASAAAPAGKKATSSRTTSGAKPAAKRTKAPASGARQAASAAKQVAVDNGVVLAPADSSPRATAKPAARDAAGDRERPRRNRARSQKTADDDVAVVHAEALIYHTAALDRLLAERSETGSPAEVLTRLRSTVREAHEAAWLFLDQALKPGAERPARGNGGRGRRPWWGANDVAPPLAQSAEPPAQPSEAPADRPKRWGR
jgi:hypothetical protein